MHNTVLYCTVFLYFECTVQYIIKLASLSYALHALVQYGWTPVINAAYWAHADVVRLLLDQKCDLLLTNKDGRTALHELCRCNCFFFCFCFCFCSCSCLTSHTLVYSYFSLTLTLCSFTLRYFYFASTSLSSFSCTEYSSRALETRVRSRRYIYRLQATAEHICTSKIAQCDTSPQVTCELQFAMSDERRVQLMDTIDGHSIRTILFEYLIASFLFISLFQ